MKHPRKFSQRWVGPRETLFSEEPFVWPDKPWQQDPTDYGDWGVWGFMAAGFVIVASICAVVIIITAVLLLGAYHG
jgi:hypothetical protein